MLSLARWASSTFGWMPSPATDGVGHDFLLAAALGSADLHDVLVLTRLDSLDFLPSSHVDPLLDVEFVEKSRQVGWKHPAPDRVLGKDEHNLLPVHRQCRRDFRTNESSANDYEPLPSRGQARGDSGSHPACGSRGPNPHRWEDAGECPPVARSNFS